MIPHTLSVMEKKRAILDIPQHSRSKGACREEGLVQTRCSWKILIVDDELAVHQTTTFVLKNVQFENAPLEFFSAYSGRQAMQFMRNHPDIAIILLDVVMEEKDSGLKVVEYVRNVLKNKIVRIILRTGQPDEAPEEAVISQYDINNYTVKTELTQSRLYTAIIAALRSYRDLQTMLVNQRHLEMLYADVSKHESELEALNLRLHQEIALHRQMTPEAGHIQAIADVAHQIRNQFLANMSHELRTPLTVVLGLTGLMQQKFYGPLNPKQRNAIKKIEKSGQQLLTLIENILDFSNIEEGILKLNVEKIPLDEICQTSLHQVQEMAEYKRITVAYTLNSAVSSIQADRDRFQQMLVHLLDNAIKFTPEGGKIGLEVTDHIEQQRVALTVWDTGIGVEEEDREAIFHPFFQVDSRPSRKYSGSGLGLALTAQLAALHNGSLTVESTPGTGSRFTLLLPWNPADGSLTEKASQ